MKALVIEDERRVAAFIARVLSEEGFRVETCSTGSRGLTEAMRGVYDVVLVDWTLPELDGLSVVRSLRGNGSKMPVLMLTGRRETAEKVLAFGAGADDYLLKPFEVEELVARVHALVRRATGAQSIEAGNLRIDRRTNQVFVDGRQVSLTTRELDLLVYIANRRPRTVTKSEIFHGLWSPSDGRNIIVVEVTVSRLRQKLGEAAWRIETVRGKGYRFVEDKPSACAGHESHPRGAVTKAGGR